MRTGRAILFSRKKIKNLKELRKIVYYLKAKGKKIVFTNGCFDILHYGHVKYLEDGKSQGDILVVALNSDSSVKRIKGNNRPIVNEFDRAMTLAGLESVDYVVIFKENTPLKIVKLLKPDVLVKGADWNKNDIVGADYVLSYGAKVFRSKLLKGRSTTNLIRKIAKDFANYP